MSLTLNPQTEAEIQHWIEKGRFPDADALIQQALAALEAQEYERLLNLRERIAAGFASGDGGELTADLWEEIAREADAADSLGLPIRHDVQP